MSKRNGISRLIPALFISFCILFSCRKKINIPQWESDWLIPLVSTTLTTDDLVRTLADSVIVSSPDQSLRLVYTGLLFRLELDTILNLPDTTLDSTYMYFIFLNNVPPGYVFFQSQDIKTRYNLGDVQLTEAIVRYGWIELTLSTNVPVPTVITYELIKAEHDGIPLRVNEKVLSGETVNKKFFLGDSTDHRGYRIDLRGPAGNSYNTITHRFSIGTDPDGDTVNVPVNLYSFTVETRFMGIVPEFVRGYFGQQSFQADSVVATNSFGNILGGSLDIDSISVNLQIYNGLGADMQFDLNQFTSVNELTGQTVALQHSILSNPVNLTRATEPGPGYPPVTPFLYNINMSTANSNIDGLLENIPRSVGYNFSFSLNPYGNNSLGNDFFYYDSPLEVYLNAESPLGIRAGAFTIADTVDFKVNLSDTTLEKHLVSGNLHLYAWNGYPFSATVQLTLMDTLFNIIDSLFASPGTIAAGIVDGNGKVGTKSMSLLVIPVNEEKIDQLRRAGKLLIHISFTTPASSFVKIYLDYNVDIKLIGDFRIRSNSN